MRTLQLLVKPASSLCDLKCHYCFYHDLASHQHSKPQIMSEQLLELTIKRAAEYFEQDKNQDSAYLSILFQGGEPTLAGLQYFKQVVALQQRYFKHLPHVQISNSIQTNACKLSTELIEFLVAHNFFFGISLDGPQELHDAQRTHRNGKGSYQQVMAGMELLKRYGAQFNVLCVLTDLNAMNIAKVYAHFKALGLYNQQYIACLDPFENTSNEHKPFLSEQAYSQFLIDICDLWYADLMERHTYISIRHLENYLALLLGMDINACNMTGICQVQNVVESSGDIFPCDFYAHDDYKLGNLRNQSFASMMNSAKAHDFIATSQIILDECKRCPYFKLCRNGCYRERYQGINIHCQSFKHFFDQRLEHLKRAAAYLQEHN